MLQRNHGARRRACTAIIVALSWILSRYTHI
nr:MAG TPA: hypothetical protein [Caudoviricetes sp.]